MKKTILLCTFAIFTILSIAVFANQFCTFTATKVDFKIEVNGEQKNFEMPTVIINDHTYLPLREIAETLGIGVEWVEKEQKIIITTEDRQGSARIKVAIFPSSGGRSETYLFELNTNGELVAEYGTRNEDDITQKTYIVKDSVYAYKTEQKLLSSSNISKITDLANKVYEGKYSTNDVMVEDSWEVQMFYNGRVIKQDYWSNISPQLKELVDEVINVSPIDVDLHEWS